MFPGRYFAARYFAPPYWPRGTSAVVEAAPVEAFAAQPRVPVFRADRRGSVFDGRSSGITSVSERRGDVFDAPGRGAVFIAEEQ